MKAAIVGLVVILLVGSQAQPENYNGTWVLNATKSAKAISLGLSPQFFEITLTVTDKSLTIYSRVTRQPKPTDVPTHGGWTENTTICAFGLSPAENAGPMRAVLCSAKWDGDNLVLTYTSKSYPNIANTASDAPYVSTYSLKGSELTESSIQTDRNHERFVSTVSYNKK